MRHIEKQQERFQISIPTPHNKLFKDGIRHPLLYLWDAWSYVESDVIHLYCLALSRLKLDGTPLLPKERNDYPFHVRHFTSRDEGKTWKDEGCFLSPETWSKESNHYTVWSGSIEALSNGEKLTAFTALERMYPNHDFLQNIALAISNDGFTIDQIIDMNMSSPFRDWEEITKKGYYFDSRDKLGSNEGEEGGPILSWRDPFIFINNDGKINLFWGAKESPTKSALVRAELEEDKNGYKMTKLFPPKTVPGGEGFTQLELPKVLYDEERKLYYLMISTCNRLYEGQSDQEVDKRVRIYVSDSLDGEWEVLNDNIFGGKNLFGPTVLKTDFKNNQLLCIAPYTEAVENDLCLTFSSVFTIQLDTLKVEFL